MTYNDRLRAVIRSVIAKEPQPGVSAWVDYGWCDWCDLEIDKLTEAVVAALVENGCTCP